VLAAKPDHLAHHRLGSGLDREPGTNAHLMQRPGDLDQQTLHTDDPSENLGRAQ